MATDLEAAVARALVHGDVDDELTQLPADMVERMLSKARAAIRAVEQHQPQGARMTSEAPTTVTEALIAIMGDLPGIGKNERSEQGYNYRGIEAITREAQALFAKYGCVLIPHVRSRTVKEFTINNRPWTEDCLEVSYTAHGPSHGKLRERRVVIVNDQGHQQVVTIDEQIDDTIEIGPLIGLGRDNSDKGANKSMTQAFKYALIQALMIGDAKDDPDRDVAREADPRQSAPHEESPQLVVRNEMRARINALTHHQRDELRAFCDERKIPRVTQQLDDSQLEAVGAKVDAILIAAEQDAAATATQAPAEHAQSAHETPEGQQQLDTAQGEPESAATRTDSLEGLPPEVLEEAIAQVSALDVAKVKTELRRRKLPLDGNDDTLRTRLTKAIVVDMGTPKS